MNRGVILVTDSLFIFEEHIKKLNDAGYEVERLDKPNATSEELINSLKGKVGYILGGMERITDDILENTEGLRVISFTGTDYKAIIPGTNTAKKKGIAITNSPGANADAVSEFAIAVALLMQRNLLELGRTGSEVFKTTNSIIGAKVGVIGAGNIGTRIIKQISVFGPEKVVYFNRSKKECGAECVELDELVSTCDIIFITVSGGAGTILGHLEVSKLKKSTLVVSISPNNVMDLESLYPRLKSGDVRAAIDWPAPGQKFLDLPLSVWFNTNDHTAYNTYHATKLASDMAVESIINVLKTGDDQFRVV